MGLESFASIPRLKEPRVSVTQGRQTPKPRAGVRNRTFCRNRVDTSGPYRRHPHTSLVGTASSPNASGSSYLSSIVQLVRLHQDQDKVDEIGASTRRAAEDRVDEFARRVVGRGGNGLSALPASVGIMKARQMVLRSIDRLRAA